MNEHQKRAKGWLAVGAGAAMVAVIAGAVSVPSLLTDEPVRAQPAAPAPEMQWPPAGAHQVQWSRPDLVDAAERLRGHLADVFPRVAPHARDVSAELPPGQQTINSGLDGRTADVGVDVSFVDEEGPALVTVNVSAPLASERSPAQACEDRADSTMSVVDCRKLPQPDGSVVVDVLYRSKSNPAYPPSGRWVQHYRLDGSVVSSSAYLNYVRPPKVGQIPTLRSRMSLESDRLTALATDPLLTLAK